MGARKVKVEVNQLKANEWKVFVEREIPAAPPVAIKKLIPSWQKMTQVEAWTKNSDDSYSCTVNFDNGAIPIKITAMQTLKTVGNETLVHNSTEVQCSIPFVGKTLTKFVSEAGFEVLQNELKYVETYT